MGVVVMALVAGIVRPWPVYTQTVTARVVGTVRDASGAAIPGASVTLVEKATGGVQRTVTDSSGDYTVMHLKPGVYQIAAEAKGFKRTATSDIELLVNQTARVDLTLQIGDVSESVEVIAAAPLVASETSSVSQVIDSRQMADLPLKGRSFYMLAVLAPGTVPTAPTSFVATRRPMPGGLNAPGFNVGGAREKSNGYLIDGVDAQDPHYLTPSFFASVDAVQEFRLETNAFSAEFGRSAAQVNATTKSGTNEYRGSAYHFFRNDALDATNFFDNRNARGKAPLRYNQFGATFGGPMMLPRVYNGRNRSFFFMNYEGTRVRRGRTGQASVPTVEQRSGDFNPLRFRNNQAIYDPATTRPNPAGAGFIRDPFAGNRIPAARIADFAKTVLSFYPQPNSAAATGNNYFAALSDISDNNQGIARLDHRFNDMNSIFFRLAIFDGLETNKSPIEKSGITTFVRTYNTAFNYVRSFSSSFVNELRLGYNRPTYLVLQDGAYGTDYASLLGLRNLLRDPIARGVPHVVLTGFTTIGHQFNPTTQVSNVYHLVDHVSLVRGVHTVKTGIDFRKTNYNDRSENSSRGNFSFTGVMTALPGVPTTGVAIADLLLGLPITAAGSSTSLAGNFNGFTYAFFVQDDWRLSRRLTLNLGLRYELNTRYSDVQNRLTLFDGAYPGGRLLIAGGNKAWIPSPAPAVVDSGVSTPRGLLPNDTNNWAPRIGLAFRPHGDSRLAIRASYGIFYDIVELQDIRTFIRNPPFGEVTDLRGDANAHSGSASALRVTELFPERGSPRSRPAVFSMSGRYPDPYYQQWNLTVQRAIGSSTVFELGYIGSKGTRLAQRLNGNQARLDADPSRPTPILSRRRYPLFGDTIRLTDNSANSSYHAGYVKSERRFSSGFSYLASYTFAKALDSASLIDDQPRDIFNLRLNRGRSGFDIRHRIVFSGSWELPFGRGRRFANGGGLLDLLLGGWQSNIIAQWRSGFPFSVFAGIDSCNCAAASQLAQQVGNPRTGFTRSIDQWFNTRAFVRPAIGTFGSSGRNILDGPSQITFDLSLFKTFRFSERSALQFRAEAFNAFNNTPFNQPGSTVGTPTYGTIHSAADPRAIQLALKLRF
jgi:outer membrane receptor protein involved in Fe transport